MVSLEKVPLRFQDVLFPVCRFLSLLLADLRCKFSGVPALGFYSFTMDSNPLKQKPSTNSSVIFLAHGIFITAGRKGAKTAHFLFSI